MLLRRGLNAFELLVDPETIGFEAKKARGTGERCRHVKRARIARTLDIGVDLEGVQRGLMV